MSGWRDLGDYRRAGSLAARARRRRHEFFRSLLNSVERPVRIVDLGGTESFWKHSGLIEDPGIRVVLVNQTSTKPESPSIESVCADLRYPLKFSDGEFDVVFSNSVIEHLGSLEYQRVMARECARIGKRYFVQTPNLFFPIEPHFMLPLFQFYPLRLQSYLMNRFDISYYSRKRDLAEAEAFVLSFRLLSPREVREIFPGAKIFRERFLGLTKSLIAYKGWN